MVPHADRLGRIAERLSQDDQLIIAAERILARIGLPKLGQVAEVVTVQGVDRSVGHALADAQHAGDHDLDKLAELLLNPVVGLPRLIGWARYTRLLLEPGMVIVLDA